MGAEFSANQSIMRLAIQFCENVHKYGDLLSIISTALCKYVMHESIQVSHLSMTTGTGKLKGSASGKEDCAGD